MSDYYDRIRSAYRGTLRALERAGVEAEMIDTGGGCMAICVTGTASDGTRRRFAGAHILLSAGGPLLEERDPDTRWELGIYDERGSGPAVGGGAWTLPYADHPRYDRALAEDVAELAQVIR